MRRKSLFVVFAATGLAFLSILGHWAGLGPRLGGDGAVVASPPVVEASHALSLGGSMLQGCTPFASSQFATQAEDYLDASEPLRVYDTLECEAGVLFLTAKGPTSFVLSSGESVSLQATTAPTMPVSFTTFDGGRFSNGRSAITVRSDDRGVASVEYTSTLGVSGPVNVLAGSPAAAGTLSFTLSVREPALSPASD